MSHQMLLWLLFNAFVLALLAIDLGIFNRKSHTVSVKEALVWSGVWITLSLLFCGGLFFTEGKVAALQFLTGYLIEKSLSVDNLFVFLLIFSYFKVPPSYQHKVLYWGILGALLLRGLLILVGSALVQEFYWVMYIFGAFLVFTGIKMFFGEEDPELHPEKNILVRMLKRIFPVTSLYHQNSFFVRIDGRLFATPLIVVLLVVEATDLLFALDSIPAVFAISKNPFIIYTSNVFAILGLRSLYFALAGVMRLFHYLKYGLALVLSFIGIKMLIEHWYEISIGASLGTIAAILSISIVLSLLLAKKTPPAPPRAHS